MLKIGFIGAGNMGGALAQAVRCSGEDCELLIADASAQKAEELAKRLKGRTAENAALAAECDVLFFAVKPNALSSMIEGIRDILKNRSDYLIISMAAGVSIAKINGYLGFDAPVIRIMPNTPASVGEGMILWCADALVSDAAKERFLRIMSRAGELDELSENCFYLGSYSEVI